MTSYETADVEVIDMVHAAQRGKPQFRGIIVPEEDAINYAAWEYMGKPKAPQLYTDSGLEPESDEFTERATNLRLAAGTVLRSAPALAFFCGASEGLMDLRFATVCAICSMLWAAFHWIRG